jgi:DNA-binding GntR family transcriptional regulator
MMAARVTARQRAVEELAATVRGRILGGTLTPGQPLREVLLAEEFGVSRHTVRAALAMLAAERLATAEPFAGVRVAALDDDELVALQDLRCALESAAVRRLRERFGDDAWPPSVTAPLDAALGELDDACSAHPDDWASVERAHSRVHLALVSAADSPRITDAYRQLDAELQLLLLHVRPHYGPGALVAEHRQYLHDVRRTGEQAVRDHLAHSTELILHSRLR